jgi:hypothetical protein
MCLHNDVFNILLNFFIWIESNENEILKTFIKHYRNSYSLKHDMFFIKRKLNIYLHNDVI